MWAEGGKGEVDGASFTYHTAFESTTQLLHEGVVLAHIDYDVAIVQYQSCRLIEIFIGAIGYVVCATLCQRPAPHMAPKIVAMFTKAY